MSNTHLAHRYSTLLYVCLILGLAGYVLPWIIAPSASMTLNANDLAEWASLHPAQWNTSPPLLVPILLRLQLVILSLIIGILANGKARVTLSAIVILLLAVAQLPPFEFVKDINNLNYRQQFFLAIASLLAGMALLRFKMKRINPLALIALPLAGILSAIYGQNQASALYAQLEQEATTAAGLWILVVSYGGMVAIAIHSGTIPSRLRL